MARKSLKANIQKPAAAAKAAEVARQLSGGAQADEGGDDIRETISFNLPVDLVELVRDLADARVKVARAEQRAAKRKGEKGPEARRSASNVVKEALEAHKAAMQAELEALGG